MMGLKTQYHDFMVFMINWSQGFSPVVGKEGLKSLLRVKVGNINLF